MVSAAEVRCSNSELRFKNGTAARVEEVGIDTWKLARYLDSDDDLERAATFLNRRGTPRVEGHLLGVRLDSRMLWAEGHPSNDGLAAPRTLDQAQRKVLDGLHDLGLPSGRDGGLRRYDQTATLRFQDPKQGMAFLRGMAAVDLPRSKKAVYESAAGQPETVYIIGPGRSRRVLARCYDKGVESGTAQRGELIRLENQTRVSKETGEYLTADNIARFSHLAGRSFENRFAPVAESADGVHAATAPVLARHVSQLVREGQLSASKGARLAGYLLCGEDLELSRTTEWRWRRELRAHGLVLVDPLGDDVDVDLGEPLDAALAAWSAQ